MPNTPYEAARNSVEALPPSDRLRLIAELISRMSDSLDGPPRSLLELEGLGQEVWQGVDVDQYLREERSSWSG